MKRKLIRLGIGVMLLFLRATESRSADRENDASSRVDSQAQGSAVEDDRHDHVDLFDPLSGTVVDSQGHPVSGAVVVLRTQTRGISSTSHEPVGAVDVAQTKTDGRGQFTFRKPRLGLVVSQFEG